MVRLFGTKRPGQSFERGLRSLAFGPSWIGLHAGVLGAKRASSRGCPTECRHWSPHPKTRLTCGVGISLSLRFTYSVLSFSRTVSLGCSVSLGLCLTCGVGL